MKDLDLIHLLKLNYRKKRNLSLSRDELLKVKYKRLKKILRHCIEKSVFYREYYKKNGIDLSNIETIELKELPIINKKIVQENFDSIVTDKQLKRSSILEYINKGLTPNELYLDKYFVVQSSGRSGSTMVTCFDKREWNRALAPNIAYSNNSLLKKEKAAFIFNKAHCVSYKVFHTIKTLSQFSRKEVLLLQPNEEKTRLIEQLNKFNPCQLITHPSILGYLISLKINGDLNISPNKIIVGGERLEESLKKTAQNVFGAQVLNSYGSTEFLTMGISIFGEASLSLMEDEIIFEIEDDRVLLTSLFGRTVPLIRYEMNDILHTVQSHHDSPYTKIDSVGSDMISSEEFQNSHGENILIQEPIFYSLGQNTKTPFQVVLRPQGKLEILHHPFSGKQEEEIFKHEAYKALSLIKVSKEKTSFIPTYTFIPDQVSKKLKLITKSVHSS